MSATLATARNRLLSRKSQPKPNASNPIVLNFCTRYILLSDCPVRRPGVRWRSNSDWVRAGGTIMLLRSPSKLCEAFPDLALRCALDSPQRSAVRETAGPCFRRSAALRSSANPSKVPSAEGAPTGGVHPRGQPAAINKRATSTWSVPPCFEVR